MKLFFLSLVNFIKYLRLKEKENLLIFYSESKFYREHFIDLIVHIKKIKKKILFLSHLIMKTVFIIKIYWIPCLLEINFFYSYFFKF